MTTWRTLTADERAAATARAFGWLASSVGASTLRAEASMAAESGSDDIAMALRDMARLLERAS